MALDEADRAAAAVQPLGVALALSPDWLVDQASANLADHFGIAARDAMGHSLADVIGGDAVHSLRNALTQSGRREAGLFDCPVGQRRFDFLLRSDDGRTLVEACPAADGERIDRVAIVLAAIGRLPPADVAKGMVREMRALSGFDRVLLLRDGQAEPLARGARTLPVDDGFAAAGDWLPPGCPLRLIADCDAPAVPLEPPHPLPATFLAADPAARSAMRAAGVRALLALRFDGGMLLCHHPEPRSLGLPWLSALRLFARLAAERLPA